MGKNWSEGQTHRKHLVAVEGGSQGSEKGGVGEVRARGGSPAMQARIDGLGSEYPLSWLYDRLG